MTKTIIILYINPPEDGGSMEPKHVGEYVSY
jgi:hypothetical protein